MSERQRKHTTRITVETWTERDGSRIVPRSGDKKRAGKLQASEYARLRAYRSWKFPWEVDNEE